MTKAEAKAKLYADICALVGEVLKHFPSYLRRKVEVHTDKFCEKIATMSESYVDRRLGELLDALEKDLYQRQALRDVFPSENIVYGPINIKKY